MPAVIFNGDTFQNSSFTCLARIVGFANQPITPATIESIKYQVWNTVSETKTVDTTEIEVEESLFDFLQQDDYWTVDAIGYNFRLTIPGVALPTTEVHQIEIRFFPYAGETFLIAFATSPTKSYYDGL